MKLKSSALKCTSMEWVFVPLNAPSGVNHNTVINWVKKAANPLPDAPEYSEIPEIAQVDELETFIGKKKQNLVVDSRQ